LPPYRLAHLSAEQMGALEDLEHEIGVTLVAYEPSAGPVAHTATGAVANNENDLVLDALVDTYRTHDPYI
jgi:hypothetical protein